MISLHSVIPASKQNIFHDLSASVLKPQSHLSCILVTSASILTVAAAAGSIYWATCLRKAPAGNQNRMQGAKDTTKVKKEENSPKRNRKTPFHRPKITIVTRPQSYYQLKQINACLNKIKKMKEEEKKENVNPNANVDGDSTGFMSRQCHLLMAGTDMLSNGQWIFNQT